MALEKELLLILNNEEETFTTKVQYASNIFKSSELPVQCKVIVLKWILNIENENEVIWTTLHHWFNSNQFKDITRNEIDNQDIKDVIKAITLKISLEQTDTTLTKIICSTLNVLLRNRIFEQYFKFDIELYLNLVNATLLKIESRNYFIEFLNSLTFYKSLLNTNAFVEHFTNIIVPTFVKCVSKFDDKNVFLQISRVIQKCIFYNNHKIFGNFINERFESDITNTCGLQILLNNLLKIYESNRKSSETHYKLIFHAFATSYENDSVLVFKFFVILMNTIGFGQLVPLKNPLGSDSVNKHSSKILLELLTILEEIKFDVTCEVYENTVTELLKKILIDLIIPNKPSKVNYKIIKKIILLEPTISQSLIEQILNYSLLENNVDQAEEYEELLLAIIELFSKLHRIENLISKLIAVLNNRFDGKILDFENLKIENILTKKILQSLSRNIQILASWQVINVFKTFLYALNKLLEKKDGLNIETESYCLHMEFISELFGLFLSSIRVAEHTVAQNVVEKTKKCLKELENLLRTFGNELLNRKHNCRLMRSFLNIAYHWAEMNIILKYYNSDREEKLVKKSPDYNFSACNITYLHPYLSIEEWCLISERIMNFGEMACKKLLCKLFIQKVQALHLFEQKVNDEILTDLSKYLTNELENNWSDILQNKYLTNTLIQTLDPFSMHFLAEKMVINISEFGNDEKMSHILSNTSILNAAVYCTITKCDKIVSKRKRKHDEDSLGIQKISAKICNTLTLDQFHNEDESKKCINKMKNIYESSKTNAADGEVKFNENKVVDLLEIFRKFPVIYCQEYVQNFTILYMFSLHRDLQLEFKRNNFQTLQSGLESLIIGILQQYRYKLTDIFDIKSLCQDILNHFNEWKEMFSLIIDNIFKNKDSIGGYESLISHIAHTLHNPKYMQCGIVIINALNKLKKVKMPKEIKALVENYKNLICDNTFNLVLEKEPEDHLIPGYAYVLKIFFGQNDEEKVSKLLTILDSYINFALRSPEEYCKVGYLLLFNTVLQNKPKIKTFDDDLPVKIWNVCKLNTKVYSKFEEYSQLILLMVCSISNEEFDLITTDLLNDSETLINEKRYEEFGNILKTWESIVISNINPIKTKSLQQAIEKLLSIILAHFEYSKCSEDFYQSILKFETTIVKTNHFHLTSAVVDVLILNVTILLEKEDVDFQLIFKLVVSLLSNLLKYRKSLIMDRLPPYLQQYRALLRSLCVKSDSDIPKEESIVREIADCAYQLEKLTKSLVAHQKDMSRIAMYLVADILEQYEKVTIYPNVKMHLNNCIYSLISICDQHAVSYLMRVLSSASTEIFKIMYENYKKYYRFTGKA